MMLKIVVIEYVPPDFLSQSIVEVDVALLFDLILSKGLDDGLSQLSEQI
jgi:hypothetical protein